MVAPLKIYRFFYPKFLPLVSNSKVTYFKKVIDMHKIVDLNKLILSIYLLLQSYLPFGKYYKISRLIVFYQIMLNFR